eukprot:4071243-Prymnesium_polylepis.1
MRRPTRRSRRQAPNRYLRVPPSMYNSSASRNCVITCANPAVANLSRIFVNPSRMRARWHKREQRRKSRSLADMQTARDLSRARPSEH